MSRTKLLLADDHQLFLDGIVSLLRTEKDFDVADAVTDGNQVLEKLELNTYDVCILDINMPGINGIEAARRIREKNYPVRIIILTTHDDPEFIAEMLKNGVSGYVLKNATKTMLVDAIKEVHAGGTYFSQEVQNRLLSNYVQSVKKEKNGEDNVQLTPREVEIVQLLAKEYTNENIAEKLFISYRTVETHRKNIMQKTRTRNLAGLIKYAYEKSIIK